jgi:hypothetical protein
MRDRPRDLFGRAIDLIEKEALRNPCRHHEILKTHRVVYAAKKGRNGCDCDARFVRRLRGTASAPAVRCTQPKRAASAKGGQPNSADENCCLVRCAVHTMFGKARPKRPCERSLPLWASSMVLQVTSSEGKETDKLFFDKE